MTRPPLNQPDDEAQGLTQEANFPLPWIKDYNPQIHGIRPQKPLQTPPQPPVYHQQPQTPLTYNQPPAKPVYQPPVQPVYQPKPPNPVNQVGTFGGQPEKKASTMPWWGWLTIYLLAFLVLAEAVAIAVVINLH